MKSGWIKHRQKRLSLGLCRDCGKKPHRKNKFTCRKCGNVACLRVKKRHKELRLDVLSHYSGGTPRCQCPGCKCAIIEFLTIDHVDGNGAKHRKSLGQYRKNGIRQSGRAILYWLKQNNYPSGFQVLCMNCNFGKGIKRFCPCKGKSHEL